MALELKSRDRDTKSKLDKVKIGFYNPPMDLTPTNRDSFSEILRSNGISPTHQRLEIARALLARHQHMSADDILAAVNHRHAETSKATVYNTLKLFLEKGLIREVIVDRSKIFYDSNTTLHHHLYDVERCTLSDIDSDSVQVSGLPPLPEGMATVGVDVIVRVRSTEK
jgi:Fur family iron response transcriptional regulator